jgi:hypothetical protein
MLKNKGDFRYYSLNNPIKVNQKLINEIIISPHYEIKHSKNITDEIILELVKMLNNKNFPIEDKKTNPNREFFMVDNLIYQNKRYRLIWCL